MVPAQRRQHMQYKRSISFSRAGEILIKIIWLEKRLVDLIILRENPELKDDFNAGNISSSHALIRLDWHRQSAPWIIEKFLKTFPEIESIDKDKDIKHTDNLLFIIELRDMLAHGDISYYRDNILYVPRNQKRRENFDLITKPIKTEDDDGTRVINLADDDNHRKILAVLNGIEEKIVEKISKSFGVNPEHIK
jgi:hypothetical protein